MLSKEKFNELIDDKMKGLNESEKHKMYEAMYKNCCNQTELNKETKRPQGMNMKNGQRGSMMMDMMSTMMGEGMKSMMKGGGGPMRHCMDMMSGMKEKSDDISYSTDELLSLFKDWCGHVEDEIVSFIDESGEIDEEKIADKFHISKESVSHLLKNMEKAGKINSNKKE